MNESLFLPIAFRAHTGLDKIQDILIKNAGHQRKKQKWYDLSDYPKHNYWDISDAWGDKLYFP